MSEHFFKKQLKNLLLVKEKGSIFATAKMPKVIHTKLRCFSPTFIEKRLNKNDSAYREIQVNRTILTESILGVVT